MFKFKPKEKSKPQKWKIPRTAQDTIPIQKIYADGIWQKDNKYSKSWAFTDINFHVADEDDKNNILLTYANILKTLPDEAQAKISLVNKKMSKERFVKESLLSLKNDGYDDFRLEYNQIIMAKKEKGNNLIRERILTITVEKRNIEEARNFFNRLSNDLTLGFKKLSSNLRELTNNERLSLIHDFFRIDEEDNFRFDWQQRKIEGARAFARRASSFTPTIFKSPTINSAGFYS